jgi:two-component system, OmpR family, sensor histidine kinase CpxA
MKASFPLSLKVSLWLLLNLLLLGVVALIFFIVQGGLSWDALVAGAAGNRLQSLGTVVAGEVAASSEKARDAVLARFSAAYGADFFLVFNENQKVFGGPVELPPSIWQRIEMRPPRGGPGPAGMGPNAEPGRFRPPGNPPQMEPRGQRGPPGAGFQRGPGAGSGLGSGPDRRELPGDRGRPPRFLLHTAQPAAYWLGVLVPMTATASMADGPPQRAMLLVRTT